MVHPLRSYPAGSCLHIVQRSDDGRACFADDQERLAYLAAVASCSSKHQCELHAYVLMTNHVHWLLTVRERNAQSMLIKELARHSARWRQWCNRRYHAAPIDCAAYLLTCQRYIELNPVRARLVALPGAYGWSSYRANAEGREDALLTPHPLYLALGSDGAARRLAYRALFEVPLTEADVQRIRFATRNDFTLRGGSRRARA